MRIRDWSSGVCSSDLGAVADPSADDDAAADARAEGQQDPVGVPGAGAAVELGVGGARGVVVGGDGPAEPRSHHLADRQIHHTGELEIGRASCRERVVLYGKISVVAVSLKDK